MRTALIVAFQLAVALRVVHCSVCNKSAVFLRTFLSESTQQPETGLDCKLLNVEL